MLLGCHVSYGPEGIYGSAKQAVAYGANAFMFYTGAPQNTIRKEILEEDVVSFQNYIKKHNIDISSVICHAPYIINLANQKDLEKWQFSVHFLIQEIKRCERMGISKIVLHPGSAVSISHEEGIAHIVEGLNQVSKHCTNCKILLETMAGKGNECGCTLEEIQAILKGVNQTECFGVCLDTCHLNDAGYDMKDFSSFLEQFDSLIGIEKILCIHINDSKNELGTHKDRHENIGFGTIGFETLLSICENETLKKVPKILETPFLGNTREDKTRIYPPYKFEIEMLRHHEFQPNVLENIRTFYKKD